MKRTFWIWMVGATVAIVLLALANQNTIKSGLTQLKLLPEPERFTELYFNDYAAFAGKLPKTIAKGETISFSFTIHNLEGKKMNYPYVVYMVDGTFHATTTIQQKAVLLDDNASTTIPVTYTFRSANPPAQETVFISLPDQNLELHFFVPNKN